MAVDTLIFKVGGFILENKLHLENVFTQLKALNEVDNSIKKIIIIPGGGSKVNKLRLSFERSEIDNEQAHWEAIEIMDQNAQVIFNDFPNCIMISEFSDLKRNIESEGSFDIIIFKVYDFLKQNNELPHDWSVTSDSIACYIANKLNLKNCYLIKNIDGIYSGSGKNLVKELVISEYAMLREKNLLFYPSIVENDSNLSDLKKDNIPIDANLIRLISEYDMNCIILNGIENTSRIIEYFQSNNENNKVYTKLHL